MRSLIGAETPRSRLLFHLPLDPARLLRARQRIRDYLHEQRVDSATIDDVVLAVEEAMTNAVRHSGTTDDIVVHLHADGTDLVIDVEDHGQGFDVASFDPTELPDLERSSGRGLYLIAHLVDEFRLHSSRGLHVHAVKRDVLPAVAPPPQAGPVSLWAVPDALAHRDERLRGMLEEIEEGFFTLDWEYRFTLVNTAFEETFARERANVLARVVWDVFPLLHDSPGGRAVRDAMEFGITSIREYLAPTIGRWLELRVYPTSSGISGYTRDIQERKRSELERDALYDALRASEEQKRVALDAAQLGTWSHDFATDEIRLDERAQEHYASGSARITSAEILARVHPEDAARLAGDIAAAIDPISGSGDYATEYRVILPGKPLRWLSVAARVTFEGEGAGRHATLGHGTSQDITQRKQAERLLRQRTEQAAVLAEVIENSEMAFAIGAPDGRLLLFNAAFASLTGYSREELESMGLRWSTDLTPPEWRRKETRLLRRALTAKRAFRYEKEYLRKDGSKVPVELFVQPVFDSDGELVHYRSFITDIAKRKQEEAARRESEQQFSMLFEGMVEGAALHEIVYGEGGHAIDYRILDVNGAYQHHTGLPSEAVVGRPASEAYGTGCPPHLEEFAWVAEHGHSVSFCTYLAEMDRYFEVTVVSPSRGRFATIFTDATDRRRADQGLRESERRYRELVNLANSAIIRWGRDGAITFINEYAQALFGWREAEIIGRSAAILVPERESTGADLSALLPAIVQHPERFLNSVNENVCRDGRRVWISWTNRAIYDGNGEVSEILAVGHDVTERRLAEEELRRSREDLDRAQAVGRVGSWRLDVRRNVLAWSREMCRIFGVAEAAPVTYETSMALVHPDDRADVDARWHACLRGEPYDVEYRILVEAEVRWMREKGVLEHDADGQLLGVFGITQDITEQHRTEAALVHQSVTLRGINTILAAALASSSEEDLGQICLDVAQGITGSAFGFINELGEDGMLHDIAISDPGWSACTVHAERGHGQQLGAFPLRGLYAPVLLEGRTLVTNEPDAHPASRGTPSGHPPLTAFLGVPLREQGKTVGIIAVGNRPGGYGEQQCAALEAIAPACQESFERKRSEQRRRESELKLRLASHAAGVGLYEWNVSRGGIYWNQEMYVHFDVEPGTPLDSQTWMERVHQDDRQEVAAAIDAMTSENAPHDAFRLEFRVVRRDGSVRWLESVNSLDAGKADRVMRGAVTDMTERRSTEEALKGSEERLRQNELRLRLALESAYLISFEWDVQRNEVRRFVSSEPSLGVTPSDHPVTLESVLEHVHPDDRGLFLGNVRAALERGDGLYESEFRIVREDGDTGWLSERGRVEHDAQGAPVRLIGLSQDVTERRRAQEELRTLYESEKRIATTLQQSFLHELPELSDLEVGLVEAPASEPGLIGGDFWDLFELPGQRVVAIVGDVAGKGIPAAGMTETVRSTLRAFAHVEPEPAFILHETNELLIARHVEEDLLVTALVLVIDCTNGEVTMASAGHPGPAHIHAGSVTTINPEYGLPLGGLPGDYRAFRFTLDRDDALVLYTDGVTEARCGTRLFGESGLLSSLRTLAERPADQVAQGVRDAAQAFCGTLRDDLEVLVLRLK